MQGQYLFLKVLLGFQLTSCVSLIRKGAPEKNSGDVLFKLKFCFLYQNSAIKSHRCWQNFRSDLGENVFGNQIIFVRI